MRGFPRRRQPYLPSPERLQFIEAGRINYSRIFFSPGDWERLPPDLRRDPDMKGRHGHLTSTAVSCSSAFILGIDDFYVVEFNLTGNASRLFRRQDLDSDVIRQKRERTHEFLKRNSYLERLPHLAADWESEFDSILSRHFSFTIPSSRGVRTQRHR